MEATREILWGIPPSYKTAMYALLLLAMCAALFGFYQKFQFILKGQGLRALLPPKLNWKSFFMTALFTGKVSRKKDVALSHGLIFWGFMILWIATDLVAIHYDTPFKVFQGTTYKVISFLADVAGPMILLGLGLAFYRRYILRPAYLSSTAPLSELWMYLQLFNLVIIGHILEGLRILGTGMPIGEKLWAPIGWILALSFQSLELDDQSLGTGYRWLWFYHMASTMVFVASVGLSKFSHIVMAPLSALITPKRRGGVLSPMDFEDETRETFGLGKISELTAKQKFDTQVCVECGRCTQVCPANLSGKPLDPKLIITKMRDFVKKTRKEKKEDAGFWEESNPLYSSTELDSCTTCAACMEECPVNIEHIDIIMEAKRYKALTLGDIPSTAATAVNNIRNQGNPWGISAEDRFQWAQGQDIPVIEAGKRVDYLYYVGCAGSYDANNQKVVRSTVTLLKKAGVSFAVMGKTEKCNGDPVRRFGDEYSFFEIAIENIANMRQYEFDKVVTHCPHCLHTIGKEYAKFENGQFETIHHTELLQDLLKSKKLKVDRPSNDELTFHDPCYLGRHHGEYNAPREILKAAGVTIKEMDQNKDKALCCGMGGGNMWYEIEDGEHLALNRLDHIGKTNAPKLATACSYCMINFHSSKGQKNATQELQIEDVAEILDKTIS
ncbi:MAG: (Fe-S)-binding protein [Bacteriovoracales bacterium]|nr:(Fe-S)-binding protein [Bacteriovoracales bacterium]